MRELPTQVFNVQIPFSCFNLDESNNCNLKFSIDLFWATSEGVLIISELRSIKREVIPKKKEADKINNTFCNQIFDCHS